MQFFLHFKPRRSTKYHNVTLIAMGRSAIDLLCEAGPDSPEMAEPLKPYDKRTLRRGIRGIWDKRTLHTALQCKQVSPLSRPDSKQRQVRYQSEAKCIVVLQRLAKTLHLCESLLCSSNWLYRPEKKWNSKAPLFKSPLCHRLKCFHLVSTWVFTFATPAPRRGRLFLSVVQRRLVLRVEALSSASVLDRKFLKYA